jgi:hypothetical protein
MRLSIRFIEGEWSRLLKMNDQGYPQDLLKMNNWDYLWDLLKMND